MKLAGKAHEAMPEPRQGISPHLMRLTNNIIFIITVLLIAILIYFHNDLNNNPVDIYSNGQAGIGAGILVLIVQLIKVVFICVLFLQVILVIFKKSFRNYFSLFNIGLTMGGLAFGFYVVPM